VAGRAHRNLTFRLSTSPPAINTVRSVPDGPTTHRTRPARSGARTLGPAPLLPPVLTRRRGRWLKHAIDRVLAILAIAVTAPLFVLVALVLLAHGVRAVLRVQHRVGDRGAFPLASFAIPPGLEGRWVGRLVRGSGLVALPQVFNVLRGDISLIGPRPRFEGEPPTPVRPGMIGLAQTAREARILDRDEVFALDAVYAQEWSLRLDARLLARAMWRMFVP
jgi:lipopolysaccharide/colanic/teichoic acid biosynthesis glycosyltransferase